LTAQNRIEISKESNRLLSGRFDGTVFYIQDGKVKITVVSDQGKEAVVAIHGKGDLARAA
jgi:CRP/FNR family cyclic AMP-dependent transcriptional regulator